MLMFLICSLSTQRLKLSGRFLVGVGEVFVRLCLCVTVATSKQAYLATENTGKEK